MKRAVVCALLAFSVLATGCQSSTEYGECVGVVGDKDPGLKYEVSVRNVVVGSLFFGTVISPAMVLATEFFCPVAKK